MRRGGILVLSCIGALCAQHAVAQMGGNRGGGEPRRVTLNVEEETMILSQPDKWNPFGHTTDDKIDYYLFPTGQDPADWKEGLRQEVFNSTSGIETADRVYELRSGNDQKNCSGFTSEILQSGLENGYSMIYWKQLCELDGEESLATLNKVVLGNEKLYILSKIWKYDPPNRTWRRWEEYFEEVYVCDPFTPGHPCRPVELPPGAGGRGGG